jgi:hypothetical protein
MTNYRFSPIKNESTLFEAIKYLHLECNKICFETFGRYLTNAGNIGIFCHFEEEFTKLIEIRNRLTVPSTNPDQKYFKLIEPIVFDQIDNIPATEYKYLYIRKPKNDSPQVGDIDFYFEDEEFELIKQSILAGKVYKNARIYDRPDLNMIEILDSNSDVLPYISTRSETEKVRVKQSEFTDL